MKKSIIAILLIVAISPAFAQTKPDTATIHTKRSQIDFLYQHMQTTQNVFHHISIDAILRDSIDLIYARDRAVLQHMWQDTTVTKKPKK